MKSKVILGVLVLSGASMPVSLVTCAELPGSTRQHLRDHSPDETAKTRALTGCLVPGEDAKSCNLLAEDGSTWVLRGQSASLLRHIVQTVTVTGKVWYGQMAEGQNSAAPGAARGQLTVSALRRVGDN
jgi:hypothetical protein